LALNWIWLLLYLCSHSIIHDSFYFWIMKGHIDISICMYAHVDEIFWIPAPILNIYVYAESRLCLFTFVYMTIRWVLNTWILRNMFKYVYIHTYIDVYVHMCVSTYTNMSTGMDRRMGCVSNLKTIFYCRILFILCQYGWI